MVHRPNPGIENSAIRPCERSSSVPNLDAFCGFNRAIEIEISKVWRLRNRPQSDSVDVVVNAFCRLDARVSEPVPHVVELFPSSTLSIRYATLCYSVCGVTSSGSPCPVSVIGRTSAATAAARTTFRTDSVDIRSACREGHSAGDSFHRPPRYIRSVRTVSSASPISV
ncbi:hypothetical protein BN903_347 [Halorubrum sp. AJ67]|nr:hypothetical protein BN903_347 [Halorubrum sp. AJ67]